MHVLGLHITFKKIGKKKFGMKTSYMHKYSGWWMEDFLRGPYWYKLK